MVLVIVMLVTVVLVVVVQHSSAQAERLHRGAGHRSFISGTGHADGVTGTTARKLGHIVAGDAIAVEVVFVFAGRWIYHYYCWCFFFCCCWLIVLCLVVVIGVRLCI